MEPLLSDALRRIEQKLERIETLIGGPRPADDDIDELANLIYCAVVLPDTIWWDDLTPEAQAGWRRAARAVLRR